MGREFGDRLRAWRTARGLSIYAIAKETGISASNLVSIEKGRRPASDDVLARLSAVAGLALTYEVLKGWQALETFSDAAILEALRTLYPDPAERYQVIAEALDSPNAHPSVPPKH